MSLWERLRRGLGRAPAAPPEGKGPAAAPPPRGARDRADPPAPEPGEGEPLPSDAELLDRSEAAQARLRRTLEQLEREGRQGRALELLGRLSAARPDDPELLLRLGELLCARREHGRALPVLLRLLPLVGGTAAELRVHDLLSQAHEALGDAAAAARHLEALLLEDLDHPQARARYARLRAPASPAARPPSAERGAPAGTAGLPTIGGAGEVEHQRYRLVRELGRGSAGTVYLAQDRELERELAVKIFHPRLQGGPGRAEAAARAFGEARLMAALRHPGVVAVYDLDEARSLVVMELCRGGTLRQRLASGRLPIEATLRRAGELLRTLCVVHRRGVVHGDLKPGNLLFRGVEPGAAEGEGDEAILGDLVLADFGVAQLLHEEGAAAPAQAGTLGYLAPERRSRGAPLQPAADLYAAGAILSEMLNGALPLSRQGLLRGERLPATISGPAAAELGPLLAPLQALLARLLDEDPRRRPDAQAALAELEALPRPA